jgi:zinc transport system substrate-binding protein
MPLKKIVLLLFMMLSLILSCQQENNQGETDKRLKVVATIFPVYDFAHQVGGDKVKVSMLLPPAADAHHYELKPDDIIRVSKTDIFLFTNFEMEQWAYKIISAAAENTNMLAVETGRGTLLLPLSGHNEHADHGQHIEQASRFDPHIWLDLDNAQKMVDNIAAAFVQKDPRNSDYYRKNANNYKLKLKALDQRYSTELTKCKTTTILHAGHWAFAYLAKRYNLSYIAAYNATADAEPSPDKIVTLIEQIKAQKLSYIYYEDLVAPRLAQTIAHETGANLLKLYNGHNISRADLKKEESFISLMEKNLTSLKKGMQCPQP